MKKYFIFLFYISTSCFGWVPPVEDIVSLIFAKRAISHGEVIWQHHIVMPKKPLSFGLESSGSKVISMREQFIFSDTALDFVWEGEGGKVFGKREKHYYRLNTQRRVPSKSSLWVKYFLAPNADSFLLQLLSEGWMREQDRQVFRQPALLSKDPNDLDNKEESLPEKIYVIHPNIYLSLNDKDMSEVTIEGTHRLLQFAHNYQGVSSLNWEDPVTQQMSSWHFEQFVWVSGFGFLPTHCYFESGGIKTIDSVLISAKPLSEKQFLANRQKNYSYHPVREIASQSASQIEALEYLLSFR